MEAIKNIIFDFGGVILNIDYELTVREFEKLGISGFDNLFSQKAQSNIFDQLETGKITPVEFREEIRKIASEPLTDEQIDKAWNAILLDLPAERFYLLQELKNKYRLFLLSNTNKIHVEAFMQDIDRTFGKDQFKSLFEKVYFSNELGLRKPHPETFEYVLKENNLKASETLFIDDSYQHIEGAMKAGLNVLFLEKNRSILELFSGDYTLIV